MNTGKGNLLKDFTIRILKSTTDPFRPHISKTPSLIGHMKDTDSIKEWCANSEKIS